MRSAILASLFPPLYFSGLLHYTDSLATLTALLSIALADSWAHSLVAPHAVPHPLTRRKLCIATLSMRQTNIVWIAFSLGAWLTASVKPGLSLALGLPHQRRVYVLIFIELSSVRARAHLCLTSRRRLLLGPVVCIVSGGTPQQ